MNLTLKMKMTKKKKKMMMMKKKMTMTMTMKEILKMKMTLMKKMVMMKTKDEEGFGQRVKTCFTHLLEGTRGRGREGLFARSWARARRGQSPQTASSPCQKISTHTKPKRYHTHGP